MKTLLLFLALSLTSIVSYAIAPEHIVCASKGNGYLPYNTQTHTWIGSGYIVEKGSCHKVIDSYQAPPAISGSRTKNFMCSSLCSSSGECGWALFDPTTGAQIGKTNPYWYKLNYCLHAANTSSNGVVCVPHQGSSIYDIINDQFIGQGYSSISDCATASLRAGKTTVCAINGGYPAAFHRRYNEPISQVYYNVHQCAVALSFK